ncbi:FUSC family protein [Clostridium sp. AM58-1XD]|nr:FUSC family protein [Clostridium sp. AM58-1XD]
MKNVKWKLPKITKEHFRTSTLNFLFILFYINLFQSLFGPENTIVGVIFTIMMSASMVRDLTAEPLKHLLIQALVLTWMAAAACLVTILPAPVSFFINFITIFVILYAFTYEYSSHLYFPYILSYLFLIFISPADTQQLPKRIVGMMAGALSIILYQWFMGRKRVLETARDVLGEMIDEVSLHISYRLKETDKKPDFSQIRQSLRRLSQTVYDRRKKVLCVSEASFSMIDAGRGLEHLQILIHELPNELTIQEREFLLTIAGQLKGFRAFLYQEVRDIPPLEVLESPNCEERKTAEVFNHTMIYIRDRILHMTDPQNRTHYKRTALSLKVRLQAALDLSPVRAIYALRTALLLSCATLLVQIFSLPHGRWFLFTLASVSLPYADDVPVKIKKRVLATMIGGLASVIIYSAIPSPAGRTAAMMLSGYISFYFSDYLGTFACSTVGALGGAVFMNAFGIHAVGSIFIIRAGYILAGAAVAYIVNCLIWPYSRARATKQLWEKYKAVTDLLSYVCRSDQTDPQLYYNLVIQAYLQEEKLIQNANLEEWNELPLLMVKCQHQIHQAHRTRIIERANAPVFKSEHLS